MMKKTGIVFLFLLISIFLASCIEVAIDQVESIQLLWTPSEAYTIGTSVPLSGKQITVTYEDTTTDVFNLDDTNISISGDGITYVDEVPYLDTTSYGEKTIRVSYGGISVQTLFYVADSIVNPTSTIQSVVNLAESGDVVYVSEGTYSEQVTVALPLTLVTSSELPATLISSIQDEPIVKAQGSDITISGFVFNGIGADQVGIELTRLGSASQRNVVIEDNLFVGSFQSGVIVDNHDRMDRVYTTVTVKDNQFMAVFSESAIYLKHLHDDLDPTYAWFKMVRPTLSGNVDGSGIEVIPVEHPGLTSNVPYLPFTGAVENINRDYPEWGLMKQGTDHKYRIQLQFEDVDFNPWQVYQAGDLSSVFFYHGWLNPNKYHYINLDSGEAQNGFDNHSDGIYIVPQPWSSYAINGSYSGMFAMMYLIEGTWYRVTWELENINGVTTITKVNGQDVDMITHTEWPST